MSEILICPTGALKPKALKACEKAGIIVLETDTPERVTFIRAQQVVSSDDLFWAAMKALNADSYSAGEKQRSEFAKLLFGLADADKRRREAARASAVDPVASNQHEPSTRD